jgi:predicted TIM-barrel fold metal-dependent hydrolase
MSIDLGAVRAIDTHVHVEIDDDGHTALPQAFLDASAAYFKAGERTPTMDQIAERYRALRMAAVVFTVDAEHTLNHPPISNDAVIAGAARLSDVLIPFASIDPHKGRRGVDELRRLVETHGVRGVKFHPSLQEFLPADGSADGLYEVMEEHRMVGVFHTGQTGIGAGMPGGGGIKLRYSDPVHLDDVAADHPDMTVVLAHPSVPWQDTAISIATHKPNAYIDLSGWSPKYFPPQLVRALNGPLRTKVLFASDFPVIDPERWLSDFDGIELKDGVRDLVMKENALRILGLDQPAGTSPPTTTAPQE